MSNLPVALIAMRMATSLASDPVTVKLTTLRSPGRVLPISSANSIAQGLEYQDDSWTKRSACSLMVSVSSGCEWPRTSDIIPELMS